METQIELVKNIIENLLKSMKIELISVEIRQDVIEESFCFNIKTDKSSLLIGNDGQTIKSLNHIVKRLFYKDIESKNEERKINFIVDVNDYQQKNIEKVKESARQAADKVIETKEPFELEPMSSYNRMIAHSALSERDDIVTESTGEGFSRRVVVKIKKV